MKLLFILLLFNSFSSFGQTYSSQISDSTILAFMKWEVKNGGEYSEESKLRSRKKMSIRPLVFDTLNFIFSDSLPKYGWDFSNFLFNQRNNIDTIFSESETQFLFDQFTKINDTIWSQKIAGAKIGKWHNPKDQFSYSIPLFSENNKYVLIKKSYYCGNLCAYGGIYLYEKIDEKNWKLVKVLNGWMS